MVVDTPASATRLREWLPRGNTLDDRAWTRRHRLLRTTLALHLPGLALLGFALGNTPVVVGAVLVGPLVGLGLGWVLPGRRLASFAVRPGPPRDRPRRPCPATEWIAPFAPGPVGVPDPGWRGWWAPEAPGALPPPPEPALPEPVPFVPSPRPRPAAHPSAVQVPAARVPAVQAAAGARATGTSPGGLRRRVPQAHLVPELRVPADAGSTAPDPAAGSALSRYQASRAAAQRTSGEDR